MIRTDKVDLKSTEECTAHFSNGQDMTFTYEELCAFHIREGREYEDGDFADLMITVQCERAKTRVMPFVVFKKRTKAQVRERVLEAGFDQEVADSLTDELEAKGYIDDREFCRSFIRDSLERKGASVRKTLWDLESKGIARRLAEEMLAESGADDNAAAAGALEKKLRSGAPKDYNKLYAFLTRRGFSGAVADKVLRESGIERFKEY